MHVNMYKVTTCSFASLTEDATMLRGKTVILHVNMQKSDPQHADPFS